MAELRRRTDYYTHFDPQTYIDAYYSELGENAVEEGFVPYILNNYHKLFESGQITGDRLLDIGTGPVPHSVICAAPHVNQIYLSDYAPQNRQYLYDWLCDANSQRFLNLLEYIIDVDNKGKPWTSRRDALQKKIVGILPIDILQEKMLGEILVPKFDIVTTSLCIEAVVSTAEEWETVLSKIHSLLKSGGHLVINGVLLQTFYNVGKEKFFSCSTVTPDMLKTCIQNVGFTIQSWQQKKGPEENTFADFEVLFVMHCTKTI